MLSDKETFLLETVKSYKRCIQDDLGELPFFCHYYIYNIPYEYVVRNPKLCLPLQGRYWELSKVLTPDREKIVDWRNGPYYESISQCMENDIWLYLVEIFEDWGDDGHTEYQLMGYAIMTNSQLKKYLERFDYNENL